MYFLLSITPPLSHPYKKSLCAEQHSVVLATVERAVIYHRNSQIRPGMSAYGAQSWRTEQTTGTQSHNPESVIKIRI